MDEAVITLKGVCQPKAGATTPPPGCVSGMTREQFEKMIEALQQPDKPPMPTEVRRNFASQYAKMLVFADAARELGLENDPRYVQIFQFVRNQILTDALNQHIVQEYSHLPDQQIEDYYKQNPKKYVEATLQRIMVPRAAATADKPKPSEARGKGLRRQRSGNAGSRVRTRSSWKKKRWSTPVSPIPRLMSISAHAVPVPCLRPMSPSSS